MTIFRSSKSARLAHALAEIERLNDAVAAAQSAAGELIIVRDSQAAEIERRKRITETIIAERDELLIMVSSSALEAITAARPETIFEADLERASAAIFASVDEDLEELSTMIDEDLEIKVVRINGVSFIAMMADLRIVFGSWSHAAACKIANLMVEEAYDNAPTMDDDEGAIGQLYRAMSDASQEIEIQMWAQTARDCGEFDQG